jgi:repressor LexA
MFFLSFDLPKPDSIESLFMQPRTKRQKEIFEYISNFIETRGYKPSYQQIAKHFQLASKAAVAKHIQALEKQGLISRRRDNGSFSLELFPKQTVSDLVCQIEWLALPETTRLIDDFADEQVIVPAFLLGFHKPEKLCAFRVQNDSMVEAHICEGDVALVEKRSFARDGDVVVAVVNENRVVLKRIFRDGADVELRPSNKNYSTIRLSADRIDVKGIYRGLIRPLV